MDEQLWSVDLGHGIGVLKLGDTRAEVLRRLEEVGMEVDEEEEEPEWMFVDEMDAELTFTESEPHLLTEIIVEDERLRFGPIPVVGERLHKVVELLQIPDSETLWKIGADEEKPADSQPATPVPDNNLLVHGTLWIPSLGLGLGMWQGEIETVRLRKPEDSPHNGIGSLTPAQRELSAREDLSDVLGPASSKPTTSYSGHWLHTVLTIALVGALGMLIWRGFQYQQRWNAAPMAEGEVVKLKPPPPEPFPEEYTIEYRDQSGQYYQVVLTRNQVYGLHNLGAKIELHYLPEAPERPLGPSEYRDIAFEEFIPWGIGVVGAYLVLQVVVGIVVGLWRSFNKPSPATA